MTSLTPQTDREALPSVDERRARLSRALKLLRRLRDAVLLGDPVPPADELARLTGLPAPEATEPGPAILALIEAAEEERRVLNRRQRLARALEDAAAPQRPPPSPLTAEQERLARIPAHQLDALPYGAILLDLDGRIVAYNDAESRMARLPVEAVLGRNFFTEVAPCTRVRDFEGRFRALAAGAGAQVQCFDFTFPFPFGAQRVSVMMTRGAAPGTVILALLRR